MPRITNLVFSRKPGQDVLIGPDIVVHVEAIKRNGSVRLAIMAPSDVLVDRREVREKREREAKR